jgi:DNA-binding IclR family transcriptional regulator
MKFALTARDLSHKFQLLENRTLFCQAERKLESAMAGSNPEAEEGVAAVERALTILGAFDERSPALTLAELASRTGLYKSTISRSLASLRRCGFIERDGNGRYRIGPQAWRVGSLFAVDLTLEKILRPIMEELSAATRETVAYYVPLPGTKPAMRMCILRVDPMRRIRDTFHVGNRLPIDIGGGGLAIRAFSGPPYRKEDDVIRKERAHISWGDIDSEVCAIGSPVLGHDGRALGAMVLSAPQARHDMAWAMAMKPLVRDAADKASRSLRLLEDFSIAPQEFNSGTRWHPAALAARAQG